jgi:hypothetical protein
MNQFANDQETAMIEETKKWEYRVQTIGNVMLGTKDENIEAMLNEWGDEGWEVTHVFNPYGSGSVTLVAKRSLSSETIRNRRAAARNN